MKGVYSLFIDKNESAGFSNLKDLRAVLELSVILSKKIFSSVEIHVNSNGFDAIDPITELFDTVIVHNDNFNYKEYGFWIYPKIIAIKAQKTPFCLIDIDVLLWENILESVGECDIFFQNEEPFNIWGHYKPSLKYLQGVLNEPVSSIDKAVNCGVIGVYNPKILQEWIKSVDYLISNPIHLDTMNVRRMMLNHAIEQGLLSYYTKDCSVKYLIDFKEVFKGVETVKMTHLWGGSKRNEKTLKKLRKRLNIIQNEDISNL